MHLYYKAEQIMLLKEIICLVWESSDGLVHYVGEIPSLLLMETVYIVCCCCIAHGSAHCFLLFWQTHLAATTIVRQHTLRNPLHPRRGSGAGTAPVSWVSFWVCAHRGIRLLSWATRSHLSKYATASAASKKHSRSLGGTCCNVRYG